MPRTPGSKTDYSFTNAQKPWTRFDWQFVIDRPTEAVEELSRVLERSPATIKQQRRFALRAIEAGYTIDDLLAHENLRQLREELQGAPRGGGLQQECRRPRLTVIQCHECFLLVALGDTETCSNCGASLEDS